jgi:hypothetical protein
VVGEYVREKEGDPWEEAEHTPWEEHTSAVISQSDQKSHILALVEKDSMLYGLVITTEGKIWYDPKAGLEIDGP